MSATCIFLACGGDANLWDDTAAELEDEANSKRGLDRLHAREVWLAFSLAPATHIGETGEIDDFPGKVSCGCVGVFGLACPALYTQAPWLLVPTNFVLSACTSLLRDPPNCDSGPF